VAIRGVGGFHLACDATNERTVQRLRQRKRRYSKPFALMARDLAIMRRYCRVTALEQQILESPAAPIVLLTANGPETLPDSVAPGYSLLGFMLPYTPLHGLLLEQLDIPVVMTSGNLSQEPQVISNAEAQRQLSQIAEIALFHNREIAHRIDDSVVRIMGGQPCLLRRARGYTPSALPLPPGFELAPEVLAYGGELKSTFCLVKDGAAIVSQHQGDLEDLATFEDYQQNLQLYTSLYDHQPQLLACDLHPEYLSTQLAQDQSERQNLPLMEIQHHHAHIASCLVDNHVPLSTLPVLGITLDGLGLGADGTLWGGEFLLADYCHFHRLARLKPVAMIGGVQAIQEPWRNTYAHLVAALGWSTLTVDFPCLDLYRYLALKPLHLLDTLLANGINSPPASSCGRLFDAVSAAVGLCRERVSYEGQGAIALEMAADSASLQDPTQAYPFGISSLSDPPLLQIEPQPMWQALLVDLKEQVPVGVIAARFHLGLARTIGTIVQRLAFPTLTDSPQFQTVVLSGGCFQNKILLEEVTRQVEAAGLSCLAQAKVPAHDGGLALGQGAIAAARQLCLP
jgi:hydrogenase maturation protein HypF